MYKLKRFSENEAADQQVTDQKEFSTKSGEKVDLMEIRRLVREDMKKHKIAYDILAK